MPEQVVVMLLCKSWATPRAAASAAFCMLRRCTRALPPSTASATRPMSTRALSATMTMVWPRRARPRSNNPVFPILTLPLGRGGKHDRDPIAQAGDRRDSGKGVGHGGRDRQLLGERIAGRAGLRSRQQRRVETLGCAAETTRTVDLGL